MRVGTLRSIKDIDANFMHVVNFNDNINLASCKSNPGYVWLIVSVLEEWSWWSYKQLLWSVLFQRSVTPRLSPCFEVSCSDE